MDFNTRFIVVQVMALLVAITVHEMAHGWMANRLGDVTARLQGRLSFNPLAHIDPFGTIIFPALLIFMKAPFLLGWAKPVPVNPTNFRDPKRGMAMVSLAGPVTNLAVGVAAAVLLKMSFLWPSDMWRMGFVTASGGVAAPLFWFLRSCVSINVLLAVFNLIPIPPLDGGHFLEGVLPEHIAREYRKIEPFGMVLIIFLLYLGILDLVLMPIYRFIVYFILG